VIPPLGETTLRSQPPLAAAQDRHAPDTASGTGTGTATGTATGTSGAPATAAGQAFEITGANESQLAQYVGQRVEITGKLKKAEVGPAGATARRDGRLGRQMEEEFKKAEIGMRELLQRLISNGLAEVVK